MFSPFPSLFAHNYTTTKITLHCLCSRFCAIAFPMGNYAKNDNKSIKDVL